MRKLLSFLATLMMVVTSAFAQSPVQYWSTSETDPNPVLSSPIADQAYFLVKGDEKIDAHAYLSHDGSISTNTATSNEVWYFESAGNDAYRIYFEVEGIKNYIHNGRGDFATTATSQKGAYTFHPVSNVEGDIYYTTSTGFSVSTNVILALVESEDAMTSEGWTPSYLHWNGAVNRTTTKNFFYVIPAEIDIPKVDVTNLIKNPGFDTDLTFNADGTIKAGEVTSSLSSRTYKYATEDGTIYAVAKTAEDGNQSWKRTDTEKSYNGFLGVIDGWTLSVSETANGEWIYFGSVSYDLSASTVGIADDNNGSWLTTAAKPEAANTEANTATLYFRAGWGNYATYSQQVVLPSGDYRLEYWINNTNYEKTDASGLTDLCEVICGENHFTSEKGINANGWEKRVINFTSTGNATIKMGYKSGNYGSGKNPTLLIDALKLYKFGDITVELGSPAFNVEAENPVFAYSQMKEMGGITLKLQESQGITANMTIQADAVLTNSSNETVAEGTFTGNSTDGVKLAFVDAKKAAYNYAVGETYTVSVSSIAVKDAAGDTKASWEYDAEDPEAQPVGCTFSVDYDQVTVDALPNGYFFANQYDPEQPKGWDMEIFSETKKFQFLVKDAENGLEIGKEYTLDDMVPLYNFVEDLPASEYKPNFTSVKLVASEGTYGVNYHFVAECEDNCKYDVTFVEDHTLTYVPGVDPTDELEGYASYYVCDGADGKYEHCGHYFEDVYAETEIGDDAALEAWKTTGAGVLPVEYDDDAVYAQICLTNDEEIFVNTKYLQEISNTTEEEANYLQLIYREGTTSINAGKTITYPEAEVKEVKMKSFDPINDIIGDWYCPGVISNFDDGPFEWTMTIKPTDDGNVDIYHLDFGFEQEYNVETLPAHATFDKKTYTITVPFDTSTGLASRNDEITFRGLNGNGYGDIIFVYDSKTETLSLQSLMFGTYCARGWFELYASPFVLTRKGSSRNNAPARRAAVDAKKMLFVTTSDAQESIKNEKFEKVQVRGEKFEKVQVRGEKLEKSDIKDNILKSDSDNVLKPSVVDLQGANF